MRPIASNEMRLVLNLGDSLSFSLRAVVGPHGEIDRREPEIPDDFSDASTLPLLVLIIDQGQAWAHHPTTARQFGRSQPIVCIS